MTNRTLKQAIARAGLIDIEAARLLGITRAHLSDLLLGQKPVSPEIAEAVKALAGKEA